MKWIKQLWDKLLALDNAQYYKKIQELRSVIEADDEEIAYLDYELKRVTNQLKEEKDAKLELQMENSELEVNNLELKSKISKGTEFKTIAQNYTWKPGKSVRLHTTLQNFSQDTEYIQLYLEFLNSLGVVNFDNLDQQIKHIVNKVQDYINTTLSDDYKTDKEVFGVPEYWLSPQEAFDAYVTQEKASDCEDTSAFLYGCIVAKLTERELWEANKDRLKRVDVQIMGSGGHALLAWEKKNKTWCPIESTFYEDRFYDLWRYNKDIFKSIYIDIWHIFSEEGEYKLK